MHSRLRGAELIAWACLSIAVPSYCQSPIPTGPALQAQASPTNSSQIHGSTNTKAIAVTQPVTSTAPSGALFFAPPRFDDWVTLKSDLRELRSEVRLIDERKVAKSDLPGALSVVVPGVLKDSLLKAWTIILGTLLIVVSGYILVTTTMSVYHTLASHAEFLTQSRVDSIKQTVDWLTPARRDTLLLLLDTFGQNRERLQKATSPDDVVRIVEPLLAEVRAGVEKDIRDGKLLTRRGLVVPD